ncbi:MAG: hypothetical protein HKP10_08455 [Kiritimatiellales bacterium]|nr:hypothetical protein [Pontiella sp.]NNJ71298.1 hypothetical protein [Kiritimatiellales bacterium]
MILVAVVGLLLALSFFAKEDGTGIYLHRGVVTLITTGIATILLSIVATSKMWYPHLWNKNSTHDRHKQHSQYHPSQRYPESSRGRKR